jgi:hypothetical protein
MVNGDRSYAKSCSATRASASGSVPGRPSTAISRTSRPPTRGSISSRRYSRSCSALGAARCGVN